MSRSNRKLSVYVVLVICAGFVAWIGHDRFYLLGHPKAWSGFQEANVGWEVIFDGGVRSRGPTAVIRKTIEGK
jgi:hypothetical protein